MELCRLRNVHLRYGRESVLRGIDLSIERGSILGLVGENGSGKSTLMKILAGILRPERGELVCSGRRPRIGYMPESSRWYPYLSGAQVLRYFARYAGVSNNEQDEILERVGLTAARDKKVNAYSKGMRQKLGLAQALLDAPDLLVLDEPTNGLDPHSIVNFYDILQERAERGVTAVLSSHLLTEIQGRTTHVAFLQDGQIAASGTCDELVEQAALHSRVLLRSTPDRLLTLLEAGGWQVSANGKGVEIELHRSRIGSLLSALSATFEKQVDVEIRHPTLNDLYLHTLGAGVPQRNQSAGQNGQTSATRAEAR